MVSISACHAEDPGSIPGGGVYLILCTMLLSRWLACCSPQMIIVHLAGVGGRSNGMSTCSVAASYKPPMLVTRARLPACAVFFCVIADAVFLPMWVHLACRTQSQLRSNTSSAHVEHKLGVWRGLSLSISHMKDFALACVYDLTGQL